MSNLIHPSSDACSVRDRLTFEAWGTALTLEQYLARELRLRAHAWPREGMQTWFLTSDSGEVLSSCETFRMKSRLGERAGHVYGVASVFTEERRRGQGYASQMLREVIRGLQASDQRFQAMILFSEVGDRIYGRLGFEALESLEWRIGRDCEGASTATRIAADSAPAVELLRAYQELPLDFHVQPTWEQLDWHWERSRIYAELLGRELPAFEVLSCGSGYSFWMADFKNEKLRALFFVAQTEEDWMGMASQAAAECRRIGLREVAIWDSYRVAGPELRRKLLIQPGVELLPREDELAMVYFNQARPRKTWDEVPRVLWI